MIIAEMPRFPLLGTLFFSTVTRRGLDLITGLLREARERRIIADLDLDTVALTLLGGLLTSILTGFVLIGEDVRPSSPERADAVVEIIMRALAP